MQVLLVGCMADEIASLREVLEDFSLDWSLQCVADIPAAEERVAADAVDVVVASARSAPLAAALFDRVRAKAPGIARLLLLDADIGANALPAIEGAHRILNRPLRGEELVAAVESIIELHRLLDSDRLKALVGQIGGLPPAPKVYGELRRVLASEDASPNAIARLIGSDPAMAAKVLRLCNSAYFGGGRAVNDVRSAVIRLGSDTLRRVVLVNEVYTNLPRREGIDREAMRHRALRASQLATHVLSGSSSVDLAATASLLAEVGMLLPGVALPGDDGTAGDVGYAEAGAYLLGLWGLPMPIVEGVANHAKPEREGSRSFWVTGAVHVSRALVSGEPVNEAYLTSVSMLDRLPAWQRTAAGLSTA